MFKHFVTLTLLSVLPLTASASEFDEKVLESQLMIKSFGGALKSELVAAMKAGGPVNAIDVCNIEAPIIADKVSATASLVISRTSLKNRNVDNLANDWQAEMLTQFDAAKAAGEDTASLEYAEIVDTHDGKEFRFMKAIPTDAVCLACHGLELDAAVSTRLKELYPEDKATGYQEGDIRGAFVVVDKLR